MAANAIRTESSRSLIESLIGSDPSPIDPHQSAGAELLRELFGISTPLLDRIRGEDEFSRTLGRDTSGENRRRPANLPYNPIPPSPGPFGQFPVMEWHQVDSSNVDKIAYNAETRDMFIQFLSGAIYRYWDVPVDFWEDFLASNSKGLFVWHRIRLNRQDGSAFKYENIRTGQRQTPRGNRVTPISTAAERRRGR